jgi:hypothetical protein
VARQIYLTITYTLISAASIALGHLFFNYFEARTYKIVTVFIALIILSNCMAKLYTLHTYREVA